MMFIFFSADDRRKHETSINRNMGYSGPYQTGNSMPVPNPDRTDTFDWSAVSGEGTAACVSPYLTCICHMQERLATENHISAVMHLHD